MTSAKFGKKKSSEKQQIPAFTLKGDESKKAGGVGARREGGKNTLFDASKIVLSKKKDKQGSRRFRFEKRERKGFPPGENPVPKRNTALGIPFRRYNGGGRGGHRRRRKRKVVFQQVMTQRLTLRKETNFLDLGVIKGSLPKEVSKGVLCPLQKRGKKKRKRKVSKNGPEKSRRKNGEKPNCKGTGKDSEERLSRISNAMFLFAKHIESIT